MDASNSQFFVKERVVWDCFIPMGPLLVVITTATTTAAAAFLQVSCLKRLQRSPKATVSTVVVGVRNPSSFYEPCDHIS